MFSNLKLNHSKATNLLIRKINLSAYSRASSIEAKLTSFLIKYFSKFLTAFKINKIF
jgi:hypothetical protein